MRIDLGQVTGRKLRATRICRSGVIDVAARIKEFGMLCLPTRRRAFSVTELLIVIGVIAILIALLVPALSGVQNVSRKTREKNDLRQIGWAWNMYAQNNDDGCVPGYLEPGAQSDWKVTYSYPDESDIPATIAAPWTWRLMQYMDYDHTLVHRHETEELEIDATNFFIDEPDAIGFHPGFGYNGHYMGGWWENPVGGAPSRYRFIDAKDMDGRRVNVVARSVSQIQRPEHMVTFCSTSNVNPGVLLDYEDNMPGFHLAVPSTLADVPQWQGGGASLVTTALGPNQVEAFISTAVPIGRYTGQAAVLYADGSTYSETAGALMDQTKWINNARDVAGVMAERFTHTEN